MYNPTFYNVHNNYYAQFDVMQQHNMHVHNIYFIAIRPLETEDDSSEEDEGGEDDLAEDGDALSSEEYEMDSDS